MAGMTKCDCITDHTNAIICSNHLLQSIVVTVTLKREMTELRLSVVNLLGDESTEIIESIPVKFKCTCSKSRFSKGIISLGKEEIGQMIQEDHKANTVCHFCGKNFEFTEEELIKLKDKAK